MSDLLDERPPTPRKHRRSRAGLKLVLALLLVVAVLVGAAAAAVKVLHRAPSAPDYSGSGTGSVVVQVHPGDDLSAVGATLLSKGVVRSVAAFTKATLGNPAATKLQPGYYTLHEQMSARSALTMLLDPSSRLRGRVTLPEGVPLSQALQLISKEAHLPLAQLQAAVADPSALGLPSYAQGKVEGFLFPATYDVDPDTTAVALLKTMVQRFDQSATELNLTSAAAAIGRTPYDVLKVASLIEKETAYPADRPKVARVAYNRLDTHHKLEFDSTVNYVRTEKKARLSDADLLVESDYNTYLHYGLPPTPIGSPGEDAVRAALHPATGDYIFFVTISKTGQALFTNDYSEFLRAGAKARADGVY